MNAEQVKAQTRNVLEVTKQNAQLCLDQAASLDSVHEIKDVKDALNQAIEAINKELKNV